MMLPVYEFELTCKNVLHSSCPFEQRGKAVSEAWTKAGHHADALSELLPACGVRSISINTSYSNATSLVNATVTFDRLLEKRQQPLLHYLVAYGEAKEAPAETAALVPPSMVNLAGKLQVQVRSWL